MGGEGHHVGNADGIGVGTAGHEPGGMGDVEHELGTHRIGDLPEGLGVDEAGVGGGARHDQLGAFALGDVGHLVEVDSLPRRGGVPRSPA